VVDQAPIWQFYDAVCTGDGSIIDLPNFEKDYVPFIINRGLSYHEDAILAAAILDERPWLSKRLQVLYLINTLRPRKRFSKWLKPETLDDATVTAEYYGVSNRVARELVSLHSSGQLAKMRARLDKGGTSKRKKDSNAAHTTDSPAAHRSGHP